MIQLRDALAENVLQSRDLLKRYLGGFDDTNLTAQPGGPGGLPNHVAWTLGHLAITMSRAIEKIDGTPPDAGDFFTGEPRQGDGRRFNTEMVSFGSAPTPEAHQYPPLSRCVEIFDNCCKRLSDKARAAKRGAGQVVLSLDDAEAEQRYLLEPATEVSPEVLFDRRWVIAVLEQALARLGQEYADAGKAVQFEGLKEFLQSPTEDGDYDRVASGLGLNPGAVAVAVHRLRQRFRDLVRAEIAQTVTGPEEMAEELRHLFGRQG